MLTNIVLSTDGVSLQIGDIKTQKVVIDECVTKEYWCDIKIPFLNDIDIRNVFEMSFEQLKRASFMIIV